MNLAIKKMNDSNAWIHIFSEGKVFQTRNSNIYPFRWGIAHLLMESKRPPYLLPFWHHGMNEMLPQNRIKVPYFWIKLHFVFGKPIDTQPWLDFVNRQPDWTDVDKRIYLTNQIYTEMCKLRQDYIDTFKSLKFASSNKLN